MLFSDGGGPTSMPAQTSPKPCLVLCLRCNSLEARLIADRPDIACIDGVTGRRLASHWQLEVWSSPR